VCLELKITLYRELQWFKCLHR